MSYDLLVQKKCSNCFKLKPLEDFYRKLNRHQSRCKACNAEVVRGYWIRRKEREFSDWVRGEK